MYGAALPLNLLAHAPGVQHVRARQVDVIGNRAAPVQTDGDPAGYAPLSVTDAPEPIDVVMG
jgi:diacylglycerol kinase (ATP)